jgi:hypothetical protein
MVLLGDVGHVEYRFGPFGDDGETIGLLVYAVSVPAENLILAQQFPNIST